MLPAGHPLARRHRDAVPLAELAGEAWTTGHPGMGWEEMTRRTCRELGGFEPDIRHRTNDATISLALVARGLAVTLLPELVLPRGAPGVAVRAIAEGPIERTIFAATRAADAARPSTHALLARRPRRRRRPPVPLAPHRGSGPLASGPMPTSITRDELRAALDSLTVVDALPPMPYGQRHLPGALNLVAEDSDEHVLGALPDPAAAIVAYSTDAGCTRGPELAARLEALGYSDVRLYREGIADWVDAGLPRRAPARRAARALRARREPDRVPVRGLSARRRRHLDVRDAHARPAARSSSTSTRTPRPSCCSKGAGAGRGARTSSSWGPRR